MRVFNGIFKVKISHLRGRFQGKFNGGIKVSDKTLHEPIFKNHSQTQSWTNDLKFFTSPSFHKSPQTTLQINFNFYSQSCNFSIFKISPLSQHYPCFSLFLHFFFFLLLQFDDSLVKRTKKNSSSVKYFWGKCFGRYLSQAVFRS